jgi:hypothetical protein
MMRSLRDSLGMAVDKPHVALALSEHSRLSIFWQCNPYIVKLLSTDRNVPAGREAVSLQSIEPNFTAERNQPSAAAAPLRKGTFFVGGNVIGFGDRSRHALRPLRNSLLRLLGRFLLSTLFSGSKFFLGDPSFPIFLFLLFILRHLTIPRQFG